METMDQTCQECSAQKDERLRTLTARLKDADERLLVIATAINEYSRVIPQSPRNAAMAIEKIKEALDPYGVASLSAYQHL